MKKLSVIVLAALSVAYAGYAEAATPKKRTRNANRVGAVRRRAQSVTACSLPTNSAANEQGLDQHARQHRRHRREPEHRARKTPTSATRRRSVTASIATSPPNSVSRSSARSNSTASADMDFDDGTGVVPASVTLTYRAGGPDHFGDRHPAGRTRSSNCSRASDTCSRAPNASSSARIDGDSASSGSSKGDSQDPVYGIGFSWHINQVYSIRGEYQQLDSLGQENRTGEEDVDGDRPGTSCPLLMRALVLTYVLARTLATACTRHRTFPAHRRSSSAPCVSAMPSSRRPSRISRNPGP